MFFFQIIRWKNLLMIAVLQALLKYYLIPLFKIPENLTDTSFILLVFATLLIAAGGYVINDIYDVAIDKINKPHAVWIPNRVSEIKAKKLYYTLSFSGLLIGAFLSYSQHNYKAFTGFVLPVLLLYYYAGRAKKYLLVGVMIISLLVVLSLFIVLFYENKCFDNPYFTMIIGALSIYAFLVNFAREICKNAEDVIGDKANGVQSIATRYGLSTVKMSIRVIIGVLIAFTFGIILLEYRTQLPLIIYLMTGVISAMLLFLSQLDKAQKSDDYGKLSMLLKLLMLVGIISLLFVQPV